MKNVQWMVVMGMSLANLHAAVADWSMPKQADSIQLSWIDGPPQIQALMPIDQHLAGFREKEAILAFRSGRWGMLLDPRELTIGRMTLTSSDDPAGETLYYSGLLKSWARSSLELKAKVGGKTYRAVGGSLPGKREKKHSPIHIVESGTWFQHVAIYDLELISSDGNKCPAKSWLEVRAWGDKCLFEWFVQPEADESVKLGIGLKAHTLKINQRSETVGNQVQLAVAFTAGKCVPLKPQDAVKVDAVAKDDFTLGQPEVEYSSVSDAWEIRIPKQEWPRGGEETYRKSILERISHFDLNFENTSDQPRDICLRIIHDYHPITGYVPMMQDAAGRQTGLPLQNSKNWHVLPERPLPYQGTWINVTGRLRLAPKAKVALEYIVAHAQWQGVPASSVAQLCLVGWGFNGFWTQMALGSWGETICIQPGRTMRRAFITDVRPFKDSSYTGKTYDWPSNVGGGDIARIVDKQGKYILWKGAVTEYPMIGPNLSHVRVRERSADERIQLQIDTYLPRADSINRSYFKVKLDVLEDVSFNELVLFQLGSDYYNNADSTRIAWGSTTGLIAEKKPEEGEWIRVIDPFPLQGDQPWVSLHGRVEKSKVKGIGVRGMVVRSFEANIGGQVYDTPWLESVRTKMQLNAQLVLPPQIRKLAAGDSIEFTVELDVFPISATAYYGPDDELKKRLKKTPDSWELTAYEAKTSRIALNGEEQVYPTRIRFDQEGQHFTAESRSGMDTVCIDGLPRYGSWKIAELIKGKRVELGARFPAEANPQVVYNPVSGTFTAVLSLVFPSTGELGERTFVIEKR